MRLPLVGLALLGSLLLNGCAVMSPEVRTHADWYALGHEDGAKGRDRQYLQERISDCAKAQVAADTGRYAQGYAQGLQQYCVVETPSRSVPMGASTRACALRPSTRSFAAALMRVVRSMTPGRKSNACKSASTTKSAN